MMKYIRLENAGYIIFDQGQKHDDIARMFPTDNVLSAGFIGLQEDSVRCFGESQSLNKKSDPEDKTYIRRRLFGMY